eukprot:EG_transcript_7860
MDAVTLGEAYAWLDSAVQVVAVLPPDPLEPPLDAPPEAAAFVRAVQQLGDEAGLAEALDRYAHLSGLAAEPSTQDAAQKLAAFVCSQAIPLLRRSLQALAAVANGVYHCLGPSQHALRDGTHLETVPRPDGEGGAEVTVYATLPALAHTLALLLRFVGDHLPATERCHADLRALCADVAAVFHQQSVASSAGGQSNAGGLWWPLVLHNNSTALVAHTFLRMHQGLAGCGAAGEALAAAVWHEAERLRAAARQQVDDITEVHLTLMRCFVFPDLEAANWGRWNKYFNNTRCSNVVAAWQLHIKACLALCGKCHAWLNLPQEILLKTLSVLCGRYSRLKPTKARAAQFRADVWYLLAWTRSFRSHLTCPTVALAVEQTLLDMAAIACILTNPLEEVVEYFEARARKAPKPMRQPAEVIPPSLWDSPVYSPCSDTLDPLVEYYALGGCRINHEELVGSAVDIHVADLSSLSARDCAEWAARRPELWDTVSGPLGAEEQALAVRLRMAMAPDHPP